MSEVTKEYYKHSFENSCSAKDYFPTKIIHGQLFFWVRVRLERRSSNISCLVISLHEISAKVYVHRNLFIHAMEIFLPFKERKKKRHINRGVICTMTSQ